MNSKLIKYLIPSLTLVGGIILIITGHTMGFSADFKAQLKLSDMRSVVKSDTITGLDIDTDFVNVEIIASNDVDNIEIDAKGISRDYLSYSSSNNLFALEYPVNKWYESITIPTMLKTPGTISIKIPADIKIRDIEIDTGNCTSHIKYLSTENLYIDSGRGTTVIDTVESKYTELNGGYGNVSATNITTEKFLLSGGSGDINICNLVTKKGDFSTGSGNVTISGIIEGNSVFSCGSGDVTAKIFRHISNYSVFTGEDEIMLNGKEFAGETKGEYNMDITTGFGDVSITFE